MPNTFSTELVSFPPSAPPGLPVVAVDDAAHNGCPLLTKFRVLVVSKGQCAILRWQMRNKAGEPIDIYNEVTSGGQIIARFHDAYGVSSEIHQIIGSAYDPRSGIVDIQTTGELVGDAGLFDMEIGITDGDGRLMYTNSGYLSVERGLFGNTESLSGPVTINELRDHLDDYAISNDFLGVAEFADVDLVRAVLKPVQEWNEMPPDICSFNAANFPFRAHLLDAAVAHLLLKAAIWCERNRVQLQAGGINFDDKAKGGNYVALARELRERWIEFVRTKKIEININSAAGTLGSPYF